MANEKQLQFDKNQFTQDFLGAKNYYMSTRYEIFDGLLDTRTGINKKEYNGPRNDEELAKYVNHVAQNNADINLAKYQYECYKKPDGEFAQKLRQYWNFAKYIFADYSDSYVNNYQLIINKIGTFDEKTQLKILQTLLNKFTYNSNWPTKLNPVIIQTEIKIIDNKFASIDDKVRATEHLLTTNHDVVRDVIEDLKKELDKELHADLPNPEKIKKICNMAGSITNSVRNLLYKHDELKNIVNPVNMEYIKAVENEFDMDKILAGGTEYVAKTKETLEERVNAAEKQLKHQDEEIRNLEQDIQHLDTSMYEEKSRLQAEKEKNAKLVKTMDEMQRQLDRQDSFMKNLKMKMASLKMGMFGNGKEFQAWLNDKLANQL